MCAFEKCCFLIKIRTGLILFSVFTAISGIVLIPCGGATFQGDLQSIVSIVTGTCLFLESIIVLMGAITRHHIVLLVSLVTTFLILLLLIIVGTVSFTMMGADHCQLCIKTLNSSNITENAIVEESILANNTTPSKEIQEDGNGNLVALASFFLVAALIHGYMLCIKYSFYLVLANSNRPANNIELVPTF